MQRNQDLDLQKFSFFLAVLAVAVDSFAGLFEIWNPYSLHTPDEVLSVARKTIDYPQFNSMQCHAAELVATGQSRPGLFKAPYQGQTFIITENEIEEAVKCFHGKMLASINEKDFSEDFKQQLLKCLNDRNSKYSKDDMGKLISLVRHTNVVYSSATLEKILHGCGHVTIDKNNCRFFNNTVTITFYSTHTYTSKHLKQAANNLIGYYEEQLSLVSNLGNKCRTSPGIIYSGGFGE